MSKNYKIAVLPGDGTGPEVIAEAVKVLDAAGRKFGFRRMDLSIGLSVNNLFDRQYVTVLSRPMPGINYEIYIGITPKFKVK